MNSNFKRKLLAGLFVPVLGLSVGTALAQSSTTPMTGGSTAAGSVAATWDAPMFDRLDKNRDGNISREEAQADPAMKDAWSKLDAANRGMVSRDEFDKYSAMNRTLNPNSATPKGNPSAGGPPPITTK